MKRLTLFLCLMAPLAVQAAVPEPVGLWEFNWPDPNVATIGSPLELVGSVEEVYGISDTDGAVTVGEGSYYVCSHGIAPNGGGEKVNEYTLMIDFAYLPSSLNDPPSGYNDLIQTDPTNVDDSDWTINSSGAVGIGAVGYTSANGFNTEADVWYRMVMVVDNGTLHDVYFDGQLILEGNEQGVDGRFSLAETVLLFCAGYEQDGDDAPIDITTVAIWDKPLTANEIMVLGLAGDTVFRENVAPEVDAGANQTVELDETGTAVVNLLGTITDDSETVTVAWEVVGGPEGGIVVEPVNDVNAVATITAPGQYTLELSADDGEFATSDQVAIGAWISDNNDLLVYWDFEEEWNGEDVNDASGNNNRGTIVDGLDGTSEYAEGKVGQGLNLFSDDLTEDGDWLAVDLVLPDSGSIAMWVKPINFYNYHSIFDNSGNADDWEMWIYGDSRARFRVESDTAVTANLNTLADDGDGQDKWWHFTCTWARDVNEPAQVTTQLYVNGELIEEATGTWVDPGSTFFVGGGNPSNMLCNATFDEIRVYSKVLLAEEVLGVVYPDNKPPTVSVGEDQTVWLTEDGSVSVALPGVVEDIDGSPVGEVTQLWEMTDGPADVTFEDPTVAEAVAVITEPGIYTFTLTATDGQLTDSESVIIDVWPFGDTGLIVHLPLDGDVTDVAGGFPTALIDGADGDHAFVDGIDGQALQVMGTEDNTDNDVVEIRFDYADNGTIALWFQPTSLYNYNSILDNSGDGNDWEMWVYSSGEFAGRIQSGYVRGYYMDAATWYHIAMSWYRNPDNPAVVDQWLYINGELVATNESEWVDPGDTVYLGGGNSGNDDCNGLFDDFRIYDRALSLEEVQQLASVNQ